MMTAGSRTGVSMAVAALAVALMGAAPIPVVPRVKVGSVELDRARIDTHMSTTLELPSGPRTLPHDDQVKKTVRLEVRRMQGKRPTAVRITFVTVDAPGRGHALERSAAGRTFDVRRGKTGTAPLVVTEHGKPITGALAALVRREASDLLPTPRTRRFMHEVLTHPGHRFPVPAKVAAELTGLDGGHAELVSAHIELMKVAHGQATLRLEAHHRLHHGPMVVDMTGVETAVLDAHTGRALHAHFVTQAHGSPTLQSPAGPIHAKVSGGSTGNDAITWDPKAAVGR